MHSYYDSIKVLLYGAGTGPEDGLKKAETVIDGLVCQMPVQLYNRSIKKLKY